MGNDVDNSRGLFGSVLNWFAHPFNTSGSAFNWVMFVGLLVVAAWFWQVVLLESMRELDFAA
jgi:hypothetical protein